MMVAIDGGNLGVLSGLFGLRYSIYTVYTYLHRKKDPIFQTANL